MKKIRILALVAAVITALSLYLFLSGLGKPVTVQRSAVVVAKVDIPARTLIRQDMLTLVQMPQEAVHPDALHDLGDGVGQITSSDIQAGEQVLRSRVAKADEAKNGLAYEVEEGMRAITVRVDAVSGIANLIKTGDKVDVVAVFDLIVPDPNNPSQTRIETYSSLILQNIKVLAVGSNYHAMSGEAADPYEQVTLMVTPKQSVDLSLMSVKGEIRLALRSPLDDGTKSVEPVMPENAV